jgi:hypothetical protein
MTDELKDARPSRIPPESRGPILVMTPLVLAFAVWVMISGRIGRGPTPIEGTPAILLGAVIATFAVALFVVAWVERGKSRP